MGTVRTYKRKTCVFRTVFLCLMFLIIVSCENSSKTRVAAPLPPEATYPFTPLKSAPSQISINQAIALNKVNVAAKSCSFSSFHRKNAIGYEWDESTHLSFKVSPSMDLWKMDDFKVKSTLRLTHALGGPANKRPCTYEGYYGLLPYSLNSEKSITRFLNPSQIKSMIEEKIKERRDKEEKL